MAVLQEEVSSLKDGEVRERTPARPPQRSFGPRRYAQGLFGQRAGAQDGPLLPSAPPRSYGKLPPLPSGPPGSPGGAGSVTAKVCTLHHIQKSSAAPARCPSRCKVLSCATGIGA